MIKVSQKKFCGEKFKRNIQREEIKNILLELVLSREWT